MKIAIIGAGRWGQALAFAFGQKNEVVIASRTPRALPNFVTIEEALECEYLIITIPAQQIAQWLKTYYVYKNHKILVAAKGIDAKDGRFLIDIYKKYVPQNSLAFLSGPSFAAEVSKGLPTALVVNSYNKKLSKKFANAFPDFIKGYTSVDVVGAEVAGAYKNVIAIASGVCEGLGLGHNAAAALISRGLVEISRFGKHYGAKNKTFYGLSGAGDLFLTASSSMSRNYRVGLELAHGKVITEIVDELGEVAEGIGTAKALYSIAQKEDLYLPIAREVHEIINGKSPKQSMRDLLK
ncbi:MAG: glycerol-3-phosphate dehydrogenase [Sulfuricurvum sp. PC08-66]|nr:MAG: glycerol-3-phosphate dehydrogenase [Sulfuricurvum sp. PC08-66]